MAPAKGSTIWLVAPVQNSDWLSNVGLFRADVARTASDAAVVKGVKDEDVFVPGALTHAETSSTYKRGEPVLVASNADLIAGASFGRVAKVTKSGDGTTLSVKYTFGDDVSTDDIGDPAAVLRLDGKLTFGAPAAFEDGDKWTTAIYVGPGSEAGKSWVIEWAGKLGQRANVKPLTVTKIFRKGEKAWAARFSDLEPVTIADVIDGGVQYKIKTKSGEQATVSFAQVTSPL